MSAILDLSTLMPAETSSDVRLLPTTYISKQIIFVLSTNYNTFSKQMNSYFLKAESNVIFNNESFLIYDSFYSQVVAFKSLMELLELEFPSIKLPAYNRLVQLISEFLTCDLEDIDSVLDFWLDYAPPYPTQEAFLTAITTYLSHYLTIKDQDLYLYLQQNLF